MSAASDAYQAKPGREATGGSPWTCPCGYGVIGPICTHCGQTFTDALAYAKHTAGRKATVALKVTPIGTDGGPAEFGYVVRGTDDVATAREAVIDYLRDLLGRNPHLDGYDDPDHLGPLDPDSCTRWRWNPPSGMDEPPWLDHADGLGQSRRGTWTGVYLRRPW